MLHQFIPIKFRAQFPEFAQDTEERLQTLWDMACATMTSADGLILHGDSLQLALELMAAHIGRLMNTASNGGNGGGGGGGIMTSATEGSVSVGFAAPPYKSGWQFWLGLTPYGQQLWALLMVQSAGGLYVGGLPERAAFRKVAGVF